MKSRHLTALLTAAAILGAFPAGAASPGRKAEWRSKVDAAVLTAAARGKTEFLVYLAEQADLTGTPIRVAKAARGSFVHARKTETAKRTQPRLTEVLDRLGASYEPFWIVNAILVRGDLRVLREVASRPEVSRVYENARGTLDPPVETGATLSALSTLATSAVEWNVQKVNADDVWALGYDGEGVVVGSADTGVEWTHPALRDHYRGWNGTTADHNYNWHDAILTPNTECPGSSPEPCDDDALLGGGHGTHTVGTMVGDDGTGNQIGLAPGAKWIGCRNMIYGVGTVASYLDCMQWFLAPTDLNGQNADPSKAPHVINNSWACVEACPPTILKQGTEAIRAAGIVYVAAAGNDGDTCSTVAFPPAIYKASFTVGATDVNDAIAGFSSRGPVLTLNPLKPHRKPDVSAPGVDVRSSLKGSTYGQLSGTSMASPHVAGLVALVLSARPSLIGDVDQVEEIIEQTTQQLTTAQGCGGDGSSQVPNNVYGWGRVDALAAVQEALSRP